jgi:glucokinase
MPLRSLSYGNKDKVNIALSVGGTKIGAGAVNQSGEILARAKEIPTSYGSQSLFHDMVGQVVNVIDEVGIQRAIGIGVSFPECVLPPKRVVADPENIPQVANLIQKRIEDMVLSELGTSLPVEVMHDAAAAVLGEISPGGTLPHCRNVVFIVWGTGIASGIVHNGRLYWRDSVIGRMTGEAGHLLVRDAAGVYEYRLTPEWLKLEYPEESLDHRLCGPSLIRRFSQKIKENAQGQAILKLAGRSLDKLELVDINGAARRGNDFAIGLIEEAGREMGEALTPFIQYWWEERKMGFVNNIIIGSGVTKLGEGLRSSGRRIFITAIRDRIAEGLAELGIGDYDTSNVRFSEIGYEREFLAFIPSKGMVVAQDALHN